MPFAALKAEMARRNLKGADIAETLSISRKSAYNKINGRTDFTLKQTIRVRDAYFPGMTIDYLFGDKK